MTRRAAARLSRVAARVLHEPAGHRPAPLPERNLCLTMRGSQVLAFGLLSLVAVLVVAIARRFGGSEPVVTSAPEPDQVVVSEYSSTTFEEPPPQTTLTLGGGAVTLVVPGDLALAASGDPLLGTASVPPCDPGFEYCLYQPPGSFGGTNFHSAGMAMRVRPELNAGPACLLVAPAGHPAVRPAMIVEPDGPEAADTARYVGLSGEEEGRYVTSEVRRLHVGGTCYEFVLRVVETQFDDGGGMVEAFTAADRAAVLERYGGLLENLSVRLPAGLRAVSWPSAAGGP